MHVGMVVNHYPFTTTVLFALVVLLVMGGLAILIRMIKTCWMKRKIRAGNNARNAAAASGNVTCLNLL
jgi:hypothetical protein